MKRAKSALFGASSMVAASIFRAILQIVVLPIVGRFLGPEIYGQVAMVTPFIFFAMLLAESGLGACLIKADDASPGLQGTIFTFSAALSIAIIFLFALVAYPLGHLLHDPGFPPLLIGMSCILFFASLNIVPAGLLLRDKQYGWIALSDVVSSFCSLCGVGAGIYLGWGAWSLVAQQAALWLGKVAVVAWGARWRPRFLFSQSLFMENIRFGSNQTASGILSFIARNIDNLLIGRYLGTTFLGYYALAFQIVGLPGSVLSGSAYYAVFSQTGESVRAKAYSGAFFIKILRSVALIGAPAMVGMVATAPLTIALLMGANWLPAIGLIALLAPFGFCQIVTPPVYGVLMGFGRADLTLKLGVVVSLLTIAAIVAGVCVSGGAVAFGVSVTAVIGYWLSLRVLVKRYDVKWKEIASALFIPLFTALIMGGAVYAFQTILIPDGALSLRLILSVALGVILYGALMLGLFRAHVEQDLLALRSVLAT
jgi:PST family polysaccharide transporter